MTDSNLDLDDEPSWSMLVGRLRAAAEIHGPETELGWLLSLAADEIGQAYGELAMLRGI